MDESKIIITGMHFSLTEAIKGVVKEKMNKIFNHEPDIVRLRVDLTQDTTRKDSGEFIAKGHIEIKGPDLVVSVYSDNLYKAVDVLVDKLIRKIRRRSRLLRVKRKIVKES